MDQATVWLQFTLWTLFLFGSVGCLQCMGTMIRMKRGDLAFQEGVVFLILLGACYVLHHVIEFSLVV